MDETLGADGALADADDSDGEDEELSLKSDV